jgi:undecaprenyl-diphosphatase
VNLDWLIAWDKALLIQLNGVHADWLDPVMLLLTHVLFWSPLYLFLVFLLFRNFKKQAWFLLIGAALTLLLCDQITSELIKPYFARLRPSHDPTMAGLLHLVGGYTAGLYGFSSGHAAKDIPGLCAPAHRHCAGRGGKVMFNGAGSKYDTRHVL